MAQDYTTANLVEVIKRRGSIPTSQSLFTTDSFIDLANDELESTIVPLIMSVREEYFVTSTDFDIVASQAEYEIPSDAIGMKLREVVTVDDDENLTNLPRLQLESLAGPVWNYIRNAGFYIKGNTVVLYPTPTNSGTLRMFYLKRPNKLVSTSKAGQIVSIDTGTKTLTLSFVPSDWEAGDTLDIINDVQPFNTVSSGLTIVTASLPTVEVAEDITDLSVGQWVCLEGESVIPQIPAEAHILLAQATIVKCLEALGDREGMQTAEAKLQQNKKDMLTMLTPRVDGAPKKVVTNGNGIFDWNSSKGRRSW